VKATKQKVPISHLPEKEALEAFRKAAEAFDKKHTRTKKAALAMLIKEGICTPTGRLTKRYR